MKSPLRMPQSEFHIAAEPFALVPERGLDGDRVTRERTQVEGNRAEADTRQLPLTSTCARHRLVVKGV